MRNKFGLFVLMIFFLVACDTSKETGITDFPDHKTVLLEEHELPSILGMPVDMVTMNDKIIILDLKGDWFFQVFDIERFDFLANLVRRGAGNMEASFVAPYFRKHGEDAILFQSHDAVNIMKIHSGNSLPEAQGIQQFELPPSLLNSTDFLKVNNHLLSSINPNSPSRDFVKISTTSGNYEEWGADIPFPETRKLDPMLPGMLGQKLTSYNSKEKLLASVFGLLPVLRIYCAESGRLITELQTTDSSKNEQIILSNDIVRTNELTHYYYKIKSTDEFIYALYAGIPVAEYYMEGRPPQYTDFSKEIHVWKWDGTPVVRLRLNRPVFSFDVTSDNKRIIASSIVDVDKVFVAEIPWE